MPSPSLVLLDSIITEVAGGTLPPPPRASAAATPAAAPTAKKQQQQQPPSDDSKKKKKGDNAAPAKEAKPSAGADAGKKDAPPPPPAEPAAPDPEFERKFALVRSVGEECVAEPELRNLLLKKPSFVLYDGFEPSGRMHIAQGVFKAMNVNKCTQAGGTFIFWVADWFALMNDKMGGDLERIRTVGQYLIEVWTAAGMDMSRVKFLWSSDEITKHARGYWTQALDIARRFTIARIKKCCQIMGRKEGSLTAAQILYPLMQCTDIFFLRADVCQLGVDQRKVNMLAREYCDFAGIKLKPIILSHHMLYGLSKGQAKMSKSNKESAIFMEDSHEDVRRKLTNAYCPRVAEAHEEKPEEEQMQLVEDALKNPCLDYVQHIIFSTPTATFTAGGTTYADFASVRDAFVGEKMSETELKDGIIAAVNQLLEPVRNHFQTNAEAKSILERITAWMAESKDAKSAAGGGGASLKRLVLGGGKAAGAPVCVVFAPLASARPTLGQALDTLRCLRAAPPSHERVLWLSDWSAFCANCLSGGKTRDDDLKAIAAADALYVGALTAIAPELMASVRVVTQSAAILSGANDYWISVINAGRAFDLGTVEAAYGGACDNANQVVTALMHVGDVLATGSAGGSCVCGTAAQRPLHDLARTYMSRPEVAAAGLRPVDVIEAAAVPMRLKASDVEVQSLELDPDAELLLFDGAPDVQRKMKKAFCQPGNADDCPPIKLVEEAVLEHGSEKRLVVPRKEEDGGEVHYTDGAALRAAFASGELHPGDLKPAVRDAVDKVLQRVRDAVKASAELAKALKEVEKAAKKKAAKK